MGIADELITRGWHQGDYEARDGSVCLYGALWKASGIQDLCEWESLPATDPMGVALREAVCQVLGDDLGKVKYPDNPVPEFNDAEGRTFDEVLRVAKIADEILDGMVAP